MDIESIKSALSTIHERLVWVDEGLPYVTGDDERSYLHSAMRDIEFLENSLSQGEKEDDPMSGWIDFSVKKPRPGQWVVVLAGHGGFMAIASRQKGTDTMWIKKGVAVKNPLYWLPKPKNIDL